MSDPVNEPKLSTLSKLAIGLAIAGFIFSFTSSSNVTLNGVSTCSHTDYAKLVFGGLAIMIGGLGEVAALRLQATRVPNLLASGGASVAGIFLVLVGAGVIGGPC